MQRGRLRAAFWLAVVSSAYVGAAKLGIELDVAHGVITPVWAPSGISLAALLVLGRRYWPAVALGAFVANLTSDASAGVPVASPPGTRSRPSSAPRSCAVSAFDPSSTAFAP